jgi:hypothetical protein
VPGTAWRRIVSVVQSPDWPAIEQYSTSYPVLVSFLPNMKLPVSLKHTEEVQGTDYCKLKENKCTRTRYPFQNGTVVWHPRSPTGSEHLAMDECDVDVDTSRLVVDAKIATRSFSSPTRKMRDDGGVR